MLSPVPERYQFETGVYRPPSEGGSHSLLVRFTRNCPWNRCAFCSMYKHEKFEVRPVAEIKQDIDAMAAVCSDLQSRSRKLGHKTGVSHQAVMELVQEFPELNLHHGFGMVYQWLAAGAGTAFLQDANSPIMKTPDLVEALRYLRRTFPSLKRVTSYGRSRTIARKSADELAAIHAAGLDRLHLGLETGDEVLLSKIKKGVTPEGHIEAGRKALEAGFQLSEYWMPGLGGKALTRDHAVNTAKVLSEIDPHYIRSRPFHPFPGTELYEETKRGEFQPLSPSEQLLELKLMVENLKISGRLCFDHAGNSWRDRRGHVLFSHSYEGYKFPEAKSSVLGMIAEGLKVKTHGGGLVRL